MKFLIIYLSKEYAQKGKLTCYNDNLGEIKKLLVTINYLGVMIKSS